MKEQGERPIIASSASRPTPSGSASRSRSAGAAVSNGRLKVPATQGHVAYPHLANNPIKGLVKILARLLRLAARLRQRAFLAVKSRSDQRRCRQSHHERDPGLCRGAVQCPLQRPALGRVAEGRCCSEQATLALSGTDLSFSIDFEPPSHSFLTEPGPLDALLSEAIREVTGLTPSLSTDGGTSDARFIKEYCPVVEFGLSTATDPQGGRACRRSPISSSLPPSTAASSRSISRRSGAPMPGDPRPIGVFDSGMGGLTVLTRAGGAAPPRALRLSRRYRAAALRHQERGDGAGLRAPGDAAPARPRREDAGDRLQHRLGRGALSAAGSLARRSR